MAPQITKPVSVLLLVLFAAAGLHMLFPHCDSSGHDVPCALCTLVWTVAILAVAYLAFVYAPATRPAPSSRLVPPYLAVIRSWSERAPPLLLTH